MSHRLKLWDSTVFIPRAVYRRLDELARDMEVFDGHDWDVNELASAVLMDFCRMHFEESSRKAARMITGFRQQTGEHEDEIRYKFYR